MSSRCLSFPLALVVCFVCGCGSSGPPPQQITVNVTPSTTTVRSGDTQQFFATVTGTTNQAVNWSVNGVAGGDATRGTITAAGLYTPPAQLPSPNQVQVTATSAANAGATFSAQVTLANPIALVSFIYPSTIVSNAAFSFSVIGSKFVSGAKVLLGTTALTTTFVDSSHLTVTGTLQAAPGVLNLTVVNPMPDGAPSAAVAVPVTIVNQRAAVRFLEQSTFGPNDAQLAAVETGGMESFLTAQFQAPTSDVNYPIPPPGMNDVHLLFPVFFQNALDAHAGSDQLRQRVMFALNQIWVVSNNKVGQPEFYVPYLRVLTGDAFGNYRKLMEDVTLNPAMGIYLDMVNNAKPDPTNGIHANENYAREFMQLFTIGPNLLNPDGTPQIVNGAFVPTYAQADIQALARAFTGWTYAPVAPATACAQYPNYDRNGGSPMVPCDAYHDMAAKTILGATLNAGQSTQMDLKGALDTIFMHPNLPPFVARRMIQHFVTSNPSPLYVTNVATAFKNGTFTPPSGGAPFGDGTRGNMQALIAAVLLDPEARLGDDPTTKNPVNGHLREPVLYVTNVLRAFHGTTDANNFIVYVALDMGGEFLFNSGSVFNFFSPLYDIPVADFTTPPASPLSGPEFQIFTSASSLARVNDVEGTIFNPSVDGSSTHIDLSAYAAIAGNDSDLGTMVDAMDLQLLHGTMSEFPGMRAAILTAVSAVPKSDPMDRARTAAHLIVSSAQYQVQR
jgi:uncharacterized protein (DUF1800 family)